MQSGEILARNKRVYQDMYSKEEGFLKYPADWVIRFHHLCLKQQIPSGRILDYGCGSANNSIFFIQQGYDAWGVDVAEASLDLIMLNLKRNHLDSALAERFSVIPTDWTSLPFEDGFFDFVLSNQVLYYLSSEDHIRRVCKEFSRCLRPGGIVFFTMMGPKNYWVAEHGKAIQNGKIYETNIEDTTQHISGQLGLNYVVQDTEELKSLFSEFECLTTGYWDQSMFDMKSNFHWIFAGRKRS